ncbi:TPA: hypothetical protein HA338_08145 [Methanosarcina acetivorans]|uniref:Uncharacterized protein n=1 Tax=Methanosarcina acetivorans TaxID=2214 RepID=A0A832S867_9EURY|nr:hypothetical protein [Methanosarcina acetivorans]HIH94001.1 hypothetical protein [Methanosarcina acetivorans]
MPGAKPENFILAFDYSFCTLGHGIKSKLCKDFTDPGMSALVRASHEILCRNI